MSAAAEQAPGELIEHTADAVATLERLLEKERGAVARLDAGALAETSQAKSAAAERLRGLLARFWSLRPSKEERATNERILRLKKDCARLHAHAQANALLLRDAIATMSDVLGLSPPPATYDARARLRPGVHAYVGHHGGRPA